MHMLLLRMTIHNVRPFHIIKELECPNKPQLYASLQLNMPSSLMCFSEDSSLEQQHLHIKARGSTADAQQAIWFRGRLHPLEDICSIHLKLPSPLCRTQSQIFESVSLCRGDAGGHRLRSWLPL